MSKLDLQIPESSVSRPDAVMQPAPLLARVLPAKYARPWRPNMKSTAPLESNNFESLSWYTE